MSIIEMPNAERLRIRNILTNAGAGVMGYVGDGMQVAMPRNWIAFVEAMEAAGLRMLQGSRHLFPLGSDNPPENMRHDSPNYPGYHAFWHFAEFALARVSPDHLQN